MKMVLTGIRRCNDEENISTEQNSQKKKSRLPRENADVERSHGLKEKKTKGQKSPFRVVWKNN